MRTLKLNLFVDDLFKPYLGQEYLEASMPQSAKGRAPIWLLRRRLEGLWRAQRRQPGGRPQRCQAPLAPDDARGGRIFERRGASSQAGP